MRPTIEPQSRHTPRGRGRAESPGRQGTTPTGLPDRLEFAPLPRAVSSAVEQLAFNQLVDGSNPSRPTTINRRPKG